MMRTQKQQIENDACKSGKREQSRVLVAPESPLRFPEQSSFLNGSRCCQTFVARDTVRSATGNQRRSVRDGISSGIIPEWPFVDPYPAPSQPILGCTSCAGRNRNLAQLPRMLIIFAREESCTMSFFTRPTTAFFWNTT